MNHLIAIHHQSVGFSARWCEYCNEKGLNFIIVDCHASDIIDRLKNADVLLWNWDNSLLADQLAARKIITAVEKMGVLVFPNTISSLHYDDKIAQKYLLEALQVPIAPSYLFVNRDEADRWIRQTTFPKVFKLRCGAGSSNVRLVKTSKEALRLCARAFGRGFPAFQGGYFADTKRKVRQITSWGVFSRN